MHMLPLFIAHHTPDPRAPRRKQPEALAELHAQPSTRFLAVCGEDSAVVLPAEAASTPAFLVSSQADPDGSPVRWHPAALQQSHIQDHLDPQTGTIFLGLDPQGSAVFAASIHPAARDLVAEASQVRYAAAPAVSLWGLLALI